MVEQGSRLLSTMDKAEGSKNMTIRLKATPRPISHLFKVYCGALIENPGLAYLIY
jgi:hypothetical protein